MKRYLSLWFPIVFSVLMPIVASATVQSSLLAIQDELTGTFLPIIAVLGFLFAGFSFITGNPAAKIHLWLAILGAGVGFGASSIVSLLRSLVN